MMGPGSRRRHQHFVAQKKKIPPTFSYLRRFAPHTLKPAGLLVLVVSGVFLPQIINNLDHS